MENRRQGNQVARHVAAYRVSGGYQLVDAGGVVCLLRCRDEVPDSVNAQYVQNVVRAIEEYGRQVGFYR